MKFVIAGINRWIFTDNNVTRGILKFHCKSQESQATSVNIHLFTQNIGTIMKVVTFTVWGIHVTILLGAQSLLLFLAPHHVGCFRISRFIPDGIYSNKAQSTRKIKLSLVV